jgi:hypothetical protein
MGALEERNMVPAGKLQHSWHWHREKAMGCLNRASSSGQRRTTNP